MRRGAAMAALAVLAGLWLAAAAVLPAAAHALVRSSDPTDGASLAAPPKAVVLTFTEAPDPALSTIHVLDSAGQTVEAGKAGPVPGRPLQLQVPLGPLGDGTYTVAWRTVSRVDGHVSAGAFAFGVGVAAPAAQPAAGTSATPRTPSPSPLAVGGRLAFYWGLALLLGAAVAGLAVFRGGLPGRSPLLLAAAMVLAAGGLAAMALAERADVGIPLGSLLTSTAGRWLVWQAVALAAAAAVAAAVMTRPDHRGLLAGLALVTAGAMGIHVLAGHAAGASSIRWLNLAAQWLHLLAVGVWIGGIAWLLAGLRGAAAKAAAAVRFSRVATVALAAVAVTGLERALNEVGSWHRLVSTGFGRTLAVKVGLVAVLLGLGTVNHFRLVPAGRLGTLRRSMRGELTVAVAVLVAAALLSELPPASFAATARRPPRPAPPSVVVTGNDYATSVRATVSITPGTAGPNGFTARLDDYDSGAPVQARAVQLRFSLPARPEVGASTLDLARGADGLWHGRGSMLSIAGAWSVSLLVQSASGAVTVPLQVTVRAAPSQVKVSRAPGEPPLYTITLPPGGSLQAFLDPGHPGTDLVHLTFFTAAGGEQRVGRIRVTATGPDGGTRPVGLLRFGGGHFIGDVQLTRGRWSFQIDAALPGGPVSVHFAQVIS